MKGPYLMKLKHPKTCNGCAAYFHRSANTRPECWLGEKLVEENPFEFDPKKPYRVYPKCGSCYKPRSNGEMVFVNDTFYPRTDMDAILARRKENEGR